MKFPVEELLATLALLKVPGLGARRRYRLVDCFGGASAVFTAPRDKIETILGPGHCALPFLQKGLDGIDVGSEINWIEKPGHHFIPLHHPLFPPLLKQIPDPPVGLFARGDLSRLFKPQVAIVGSRRGTPGGQDVARTLAAGLVERGFSVISGLASGIDGAAHWGAIDHNGSTVAVTAAGADRIYPAAHRRLADKISSCGALLTEYSLGIPPRREHFPARNRLISGLALGVVVVEAASRSGSLITARLGGEQGREVFAVPGPIRSPLSAGCHQLIKQGAKLVEGIEDIVDELPRFKTPPASRDPIQEQEPGSVVADEVLVGSIDFTPTPLEVIVDRSGLTDQQLSSILLGMELRGLIAATTGGGYQRIK